MSSKRYFAQINANIVTNVIVADSKEWCSECLGGRWEETFMSGKPRRYAGIGWQYLPTANSGVGEFIWPPPYASWVINGNIEWEPPFQPPVDGNLYRWDESNVTWALAPIDP